MSKFLDISIDTSDLMRKLEIVGKEIEAKGHIGMEKAMKEFMTDCLDVSPSVPIDTGALSASHSIFVDNKLIATSANRPHKGEATPLETLSEPITNSIVGTLVARRKYAASLHEGISRWGTAYKYKSPGSGAKWIQGKFSFVDKYIKIIADTIKK